MDGTTGKKKIWQRIRDTYRIIILDDENLEEVGSYNLSLLSFYVLLSVAGLIISLVVISFIFFTPVKRLIPGYGDISDNKKFIELVKKVDILESEVSAYQVYIGGLQKILSAGSDNSGDLPAAPGTLQSKRTPELVNQADIKETSRTKELNFLKFASPVYGKISAGFQPDIQHYGVDILAPKDTPIKAIMDGIVLSAEQSLTTGNSVYIQHNKNVVSVYKHNSVLLVKTGDIIKTGQAIAIIGNTGEQSTGPHLHFEMWYDGKYVNPENYITFQ
ncbi:MAG: M23 family metallopeptidase [Chitinophagales bacterium]|nr:M23 family metallopeptidase [Chitinophagales bacterium]